jgi:uncharacterized protein
MPESVIQIRLKAVMPASGGCAVFLGNDEKVFVIYIDQMVGMAIAMYLRGVPKERPLTHDMTISILTAYGIKLQRVVINDFKESIYYARLILHARNELEQLKIMEIDARPSDSIALAVRLNAPIYITQSVWDNAADDSKILAAMQEKGAAASIGGWSGDEFNFEEEGYGDDDEGTGEEDDEAERKV